jgi:hypothetical protein
MLERDSGKRSTAVIKYLDGTGHDNDGRHGWLRVTPLKIVSWDFRKNPTLRTGAAPEPNSRQSAADVS